MYRPMSDFVAEAGNQSVSDWTAGGQQAGEAVAQLCAASLQSALQTLQAALWAAETAAGSAGAAAEVAELARQIEEAAAGLVAQATKAAA